MRRFRFDADVPPEPTDALLLIEANGAALGASLRAERRGRCGGGHRRTVFEVEAIVHLTLRIDTGTEAHRPRQPGGAHCAVQRAARHLPINGHDGKRKRIVERAGAREERRVERVGTVAARGQQGELRLRHRFARATGDVQRVGQPRIARQLIGGERPGILGARRIVARALDLEARARHRGQRASEGTGGVEMRPLPRTVARGARERPQPSAALHAPRGVAATARGEHGAAPQSTAVPHARIDRERTRRWRPRAKVEHPAGSVAVQGCRRTPDDVHTTDRLEIKPVEGRLPIGKRERDPVAQDAHTAHPEGRPRAESTNGDPRILRRIGTILHLHPGDAQQQITDAAATQRRAVVDGGARPGERQFQR